MNPILYAVQHIQPLNKGKSHPQILLLSDGREYVVKFKMNFDGIHRHTTRSLVNEWLAGKLGALLSLPVVPFETVHIPQSFIDANKILLKRNFMPGTQFASLFIPNCITLDKGITPPHKNQIRNREAIAALIVFDHWVGNVDRARSNILLQPNTDGSYDFHMIDHGDCFPGKFQWTKETLQQGHQALTFKAAYKWCVSVVKDRNQLYSFVEKVRTLSDELIDQVIQAIPDDWEVDREEKEALRDYLVKGKDVLPQLVENFADQYANYNRHFKKRS